MKRPKDMTPEELLALPVYSHFNETITIDPKTGITYRKASPQKMRCCPMYGGDIAFWTDSSGSWSPVYLGENEGWAKEPFFM